MLETGINVSICFHLVLLKWLISIDANPEKCTPLRLVTGILLAVELEPIQILF